MNISLSSGESGTAHGCGKLGFLRSAKGISVIRDTPHVNSMAVIADSGNFSDSQWARVIKPGLGIISRENCMISAYDNSGLGKAESFWKRIWQNLYLKDLTDVECGGLAMVLCKELDGDWYSRPKIAEKFWFHRQIGTQLPSSGIATDYYLPETKKSEQKSDSNKPARKVGETTSVFSHQTFVFLSLALGIIFQLAGLSILEDGRVVFGASLAVFGVLLSGYSGLLALNGHVAEQFQR